MAAALSRSSPVSEAKTTPPKQSSTNPRIDPVKQVRCMTSPLVKISPEQSGRILTVNRVPWGGAEKQSAIQRQLTTAKRRWIAPRFRSGRLQRQSEENA